MFGYSISWYQPHIPKYNYRLVKAQRAHQFLADK